MGPTEDSIIIPTEDAAPYIARWISESQELAKLPTEGVLDLQVDGGPTSGAGEGPPTQPHADVGQEDLLTEPTDSKTFDAPEISHATASSVLPPEEEDPTLPQDIAPFSPHATNDAKTNHDPPSTPLPAHEAAQTADDLPPSAIPAIRSLDEPPLPPAKKRRVPDAPPVPSEDATVGRTLRSAAKKAVDTTSTAGGGPIPIPLTVASSSNEKGRAAVEGPKTRSTTRAPGSETSARAKPARTRPTPKPSEKSKRAGKAVGKAKA